MTATPDSAAPRWLLLHGTPLTPAVWEPVADRLPGTVWAPEVAPAPGTVAPQRALAHEVVRRVDPDRGGRWRVVGHSFGGQIALELAAVAPDLVEDLTIVCSRDTPFSAFAAAADKLDGGGPVDVEGTVRRWFRPAEIAARPAFIDDIATQLQRADQRSWATALRGIASFDAAELTAGLSVRARVIAAEHDVVGTPEAMEGMAQRLAASFTVLPDASHLSVFLRPADFAALLTTDPESGASPAS